MLTWHADINWSMVLQIGVLTCLVWITTRQAKKAPAAWRHALWVVVVLKVLIPWNPYIPTQLVFWREPASIATTTAISVTPPSLQATLQTAARKPRDANCLPQKPITKETPVEVKQVVNMIICLVWLAGVGIFALALRRRYKRQQELISDAWTARDGLPELLADCMSRMGVRGTPKLLLSDDVTTPVLMGLRRPAILLPTSIRESCDEQALRAMLMHELAHMVRRDMLFIWLHQIAQTVCWPHPAVWLAGRELRREAEIAADELVLTRGGIASKVYADGYVSALRLANSGSRYKLSLSMAEPFEIESNRILLMLREVLPRLTRAWVAGLVLAAVIALPTFAGYVAVRKTSKVETMDWGHSLDKEYHYAVPPAWKWQDVSVTVESVEHSWPKYTKDRKMPDGSIMSADHQRIEVNTRLRSSSGRWELDDIQIRANHGSISLNEDGIGGYTIEPNPRYSVTCRAPSRQAQSLDLSATAIERSPVVMTSAGPLSMSQAKRPLAFPDQGLIMATANWRTDPLPVSYVYREAPSDSPGAYGPFAHEAEHIAEKKPYLSFRVLYTTATWCTTSKPCDLVVYDARGRSLPMKIISDFGDRAMAGNLPYVDHGPELYLGMQVTVDYGEDYETDPLKLKVSRLDPLGPAQTAGIRVGDVVTKVNGTRIWYMHDFATVGSYSEQSHGLKPLSITILRNGKTTQVKIMPVWDPLWATYASDIQSVATDTQMAAHRLASSVMATRQMYLYSTKPIPPGFVPTKLEFKVSSQPIVRKVRFNIENVPLPEGFWDKRKTSDSRKGS